MSYTVVAKSGVRGVCVEELREDKMEWGRGQKYRMAHGEIIVLCHADRHSRDRVMHIRCWGGTWRDP